MKFRLLIFLFLLPFFQTSCVEEPIELSREDRKVVDSLFTVQRKVLKSELDSLCDERFDRLVQSKVDSIIEERLLEIERLMNRQ